MEQIGRVVAVCISENKGTVKHPIDEAVLKTKHGIVGDAHAGDWHRQVSLLAKESVDQMREKYPDIPVGAFAENLLTEGIEVSKLPIGTILKIGQAQLQVTQIGKECHRDCAIRKQVGDCVMPREGIFAIVIEDGVIRPGDFIHVLRS